MFVKLRVRWESGYLLVVIGQGARRREKGRSRIKVVQIDNLKA